ncbi:hypothetical protein [Bacteroides sp.]|uniref:hypothetical protein n=1 Tax=Bacteroides sp. TaxID=29523 RepID=UPI00257D582D|nr:hypothetical protein [Bacteroides sp.]
MRLVDADELKKELYQQWFMDILLTQRNSEDMFYALAQKIDAQTTAYDVDKVVEQLEKRIQTHERCIEYEKKNGTITEEFQQRKAVEVLKDAIEIVKGGGADGN